MTGPDPKHHSIQARMSEKDPRLYNVNRDLAHNFEFIVKLVAGRLEDDLWPELAELLKDRGVSQSELGEACVAYCRFIATEVKDPKEGVQEAMERSGWFQVRPEAQIAFMALLGTVVSGIQFHGVREATLGGEGPAQTLPELLEVGKETSLLLSQPRWKRKIRRYWRRLTSAFKVLAGK